MYDLPFHPKSPKLVRAVIEIEEGSKNKYEYNGDLGVFEYDRCLTSAMVYPASYGFIPNTLCDDGDPLDILANGTIIAKGEVVMIGERFGIRFTEVVDPKERVQNL